MGFLVIFVPYNVCESNSLDVSGKSVSFSLDHLPANKSQGLVALGSNLQRQKGVNNNVVTMATVAHCGSYGGIPGL